MSHPRPPGSGRHRLHRKDDEVTRRRSGDANPRGKLERPEGLFRLRPDLAAPGGLPFAEALPQVVADWDRQVANGTISESNIEVYARHLKPSPVSSPVSGSTA